MRDSGRVRQRTALGIKPDDQRVNGLRHHLLFCLAHRRRSGLWKAIRRYERAEKTAPGGKGVRRTPTLDLPASQGVWVKSLKSKGRIREADGTATDEDAKRRERVHHVGRLFEKVSSLPVFSGPTLGHFQHTSLPLL